MNVANLITILRFPLLVAVVWLLYYGDAVGQLVAAFLIVVIDLTPQAANIDIYKIRHAVEVIVPGMLLEHRPCDNHIGVAHQVFKYYIFLGSQLYHLLPTSGLSGLCV